MKKSMSFLYEKSILILPMFFILLMNFRCLFKPYIPVRDTLHMYENFNLLYNEYFVSGHIPQWMPNHAFGIPTSYVQLLALTPSSYLMFVIGKLIRITDISLLFKLSVCIDQLILLFGSYLLSKQIFKSNLTIFIICSSILCNTFWHDNINFHLRIYYILPLILYFFLMFYKKNWLGYLFLALFTTVISVTGDLIYFLPLKAFFLLIFNLCLYWQYKPSWKSFSLSLFQLILFAIFVIFLVCFYYQLAVFGNFVNTPYRDNGQQNSLSTFLTYWSIPSGSIGSFFTNNISGLSSLVYMGVLPALFLIFGFFTVRSRTFFAFLLPGGALLWLSFAAIFATISYYFPGMSYYRHITHVYGLYNIFFIISSGFGLDYFLELSTRNKVKVLFFITIGLIFIMDGSDMVPLRLTWTPMILESHSVLDFLKKIHLTDEFFRVGIHFISFVLILSVACIRLFLFSKNKQVNMFDPFIEKFLRIILFLCFVLDMYSYLNIYNIQPQTNDDKFPYMVQVSKLEFQSRRHDTPENERERNVISIRDTHAGGYETLYNIAQFSPCVTAFKGDYVPKRVTQLFDLKGEISKENFNIITACESPKLRLIPEAIESSNLVQTKKLFKLIPDFSNSFILNGKGETSLRGNVEKIKGNQEIKVKLFNTDSLTLETDVLSNNGAWLVYADSFHSAWKAKVNGQYSRVFPANIAFKAVHLQKGHNVVRLSYDNFPSRMASYVIAFISLIFCLFLLGWFGKELIL